MELLLLLLGLLTGVLLAILLEAARLERPTVARSQPRATGATIAAVAAADALEAQWQALFAYEGQRALPDEPTEEEADR
ncbi:MAG: hypothetical protein RR320_00915 [Oscillospiraceae bacterium]